MIEDTDHIVIVNSGGDHAIWPAGGPVPEGWTRVGPRGSKAECIAYVDDAWQGISGPRANAAEKTS